MLQTTLAICPCLKLLCSLKTVQFEMEYSRSRPLAGGSEDDEGIEVFGRAEGINLKQGSDGIPVAEMCRRAGISQATYFNWSQRNWSCPDRRKGDALHSELQI